MVPSTQSLPLPGTILGVVLAAFATVAASQGVASVDLVGQWNYALSTALCPDVVARGVSTYTYRNGTYGWSHKGQQLQNSCQLSAMDCTDYDFVASNPITSSELLAMIEAPTRCWEFDLPDPRGDFRTATIESPSRVVFAGELVSMVMNKVSGGTYRTVYEDGFAGGLAGWTAQGTGGSYNVVSGALVAHSPICVGPCPYGDLVLRDEHQVAGDAEASVEFAPIADQEQPTLVTNGFAFSLWQDAGHKIRIGAVVTDTGVAFSAQRWDGQWHSIKESVRDGGQARALMLDTQRSHRATLVKTGRTYRLHIGDVYIDEIEDTYLNGDGRIGLHVQGTRKFDDFRWKKGNGPAGGLWAIDEEVNGQPGRGFQFELRGGVLVATVYGYDASGHAAFYLAAGPLEDNNLVADLNHYRDGTAFGGAFRSASLAGMAGPLVVQFADSRNGTITFPGEPAKRIRKFDWAGAIDVRTADPVGGLWAVDAEVNGQPGRGFQVEVQERVLVMAVYAYEGTGQNTFYLASGPLSGNRFTGALNYYSGGTSFGGPFRPAVLAGSAGQVLLEFTDGMHGTVTFPGEPPRKISKFLW